MNESGLELLKSAAASAATRRFETTPPAPISAPSPVPSTAVAMTAAAGSVDKQQKPQQKWNTKNLGLRLAADALSATSAAILITPIISIIDRYPPTPSQPPGPN
jgi:hypothetical protein